VASIANRSHGFVVALQVSALHAVLGSETIDAPFAVRLRVWPRLRRAPMVPNKSRSKAQESDNEKEKSLS